jgi:plastocyanin
MATTYQLISANTLATNAASVTFSSIPQTYTDLSLRFSIRRSDSGFSNAFSLRVNAGDTISWNNFYYNGSAAGAYTGSNPYVGDNFTITGSSNTANTFGVGEMYIPSYSVAMKHQFATKSNTEQNASSILDYTVAAYNLASTAITSLQIYDPINSYTLLAGSSFYLYGIKNS